MIACGHLYTGVFEAGGGERIDSCTFPVRHTDSFVPQRSDSAEMHHMRQIMWGFFLSKVSKPVLLEPTNQLWTWTLASRDLFNCRKCFCLAHHHQLLSPPWQPDEWHYSSLCSCSSSLTPLFFSFFGICSFIYDADSAQVCFCLRVRDEQEATCAHKLLRRSEINVRKLRRLSCLK